MPVRFLLFSFSIMAKSGVAASSLALFAARPTVSSVWVPASWRDADSCATRNHPRIALVLCPLDSTSMELCQRASYSVLVAQHQQQQHYPPLSRSPPESDRRSQHYVISIPRGLAIKIVF
uniref:Putative secreted peptide n=1 Tax=Anopheles braziliensis TaxID=58242 RepID=A0A2M3ZTS9_9DIPT